MKTIIRRLIRAAGFDIRRAGMGNRFQAVDDTLALLRRLGFSPTTIIDVGANVGDWSRAAHLHFPSARLALVEPQRACERRLRELDYPGTTVHLLAASAPGVTEVAMEGVDEQPGTGAHVTSTRSPTTVTCPASTLDALFGASTASGGPVLLKLDVEGHELPALSGATQLLTHCEVVITEFPLFSFDGDPQRPVFADYVATLRDHGFELFDIAALSGRPRDGRLRQGDAVFVSRRSPLRKDSTFV